MRSLRPTPLRIGGPRWFPNFGTDDDGVAAVPHGCAGRSAVPLLCRSRVALPDTHETQTQPSPKTLAARVEKLPHLLPVRLLSRCHLVRGDRTERCRIAGEHLSGPGKRVGALQPEAARRERAE